MIDQMAKLDKMLRIKGTDNLFACQDHFHYQYDHFLVINDVYLLLFFFHVTPLTGSRTGPGPANRLTEVIESAMINPFCYPNSYWAEL